MNRIILCLLFAAPASLLAQSPMFGLFSNHYLETVGTQGNLRRVNKPISIIYNREYCWFYSPNGDIVSFRTRSYTKDVNSSTKSIHESFVNDESRTTADGFYHIMVDRMNDGTTFQISTPTGTLVIENAEVFSENGRLKTGTMKIDWDAVRAGERKADSAAASKKARGIHLQDSLIVERKKDTLFHDSLMAVAKRMKIFTGDNPPTDWLISIIESRKADSLRKAQSPTTHKTARYGKFP